MGQLPTPDFHMVSEAERRVRYGRAPWERRSALPAIVRAMLLFLFVGAGAVLVWALHDLPLSSALKSAAQPIIILEAADGQELGRRDAGRGLPVEYSQIPKTLVDAVIAIEDRRFYEHNGIDFRGVLRAFARNIQAGGVKQGGSTITQQLARTLIGEDDRTIRRKIRETILALYMEAHLSKDEILTRYLNNIYFGAGVTGISAAAQVYFRKKVKQLTLAESAVLAGLIQAPSHLNPLSNPRAARERARLVLDAMASNGSLTRRQARTAKKRPAQVRRGKLPAPVRSWFADWIHGEALKLAQAQGFQGGLLRLRTTLSPGLQSLAERVVANSLKQDRANRRAQVAIVAMKPNGAVVAMVGGRNHSKSPFNRAVQAKRQPGSTFKLFVYYAALRNGYSPDDFIEDAPVKIGRWAPQNLDRRHYGRVTLREAFARSLNLATVRLAQEVGIDEVIEAARRLGLDAPLAATPSLALGTSEVSLIDLTAAYASVLAGEAPIEPWGIVSANGANGAQLDHPRRRVPRVKLADEREMLTDFLMQAVAQGTGQAAMWHGPAAGKTGTTADNRDAWFVGFSDRLVVGVWVGNDDNTPLKNIAGGDLPARIWRDFVASAGDFWEEAPEEEWVARSEDLSRWMPRERLRRSFAEIIGELFSREERQTQALGGPCNYEACTRSYRSFRASDCSYQPYSGKRKQCVIEEEESPWEIVTEGGFWEEDVESNSYAYDEADEY
jgi:penicillin-binding protein 1A